MAALIPKLLLIILDGVADRPDPSLNWTTPLEAARTTYLDRIARGALLKRVQPLGKRLAPESDVAVFSILGYRFEGDYPGRGVVEAVGAGLDFRNGDLALRANFATISGNGTIMDRRVGRDLTNGEALKLSNLINREVKLDGATFSFVSTVGYRGVLVIRASEPLSAALTNTDPAYIRAGRMGFVREDARRTKLLACKPTTSEKSSKIAAGLVNSFVQQSLRVLSAAEVNATRASKNKKVANAILLRDAGSFLPTIKKLPEKYARSFAAVVDMPVERGISRLTGMEEFEAGGQDDYEAKAAKCVDLLDKFDVVYVHLKGPDEPGHDGDAKAKKEIIEEIDLRFFKIILGSRSRTESYIVITADHATPCQLRAHSHDPVPLLVHGPSISKKFGCRFTERNSRNASSSIMPSYRILDWVMTEFLNRPAGRSGPVIQEGGSRSLNAVS